MEGFGAFREPTRIDFTDADLFALQGPTGAGKSTVIDAICFALYGNVPRYDDQRLVGAAMSMNAAEMRVRLRFEVAGQLYDAVRVVRRSSGSAPGSTRVSTKEARLELVGGVVLAGKEGELRGAVEDLLGLTFDDFTRCVVLPQGAFARFLHDKPADRQALLVRLLDLGVYGRMVQRANTRGAELDRELAFIDGRLDGLGEASAETLAAIVAALERVGTAEAEYTRRAPLIAAGAADVERVDGQLGEHQRWLTALSAVRVPDEAAALADRLASSRAAVDAAEHGHRDALDELDRAGQAVAENPAVAAIRAQIELHQRLAKGHEVVGQLGHDRSAHEQRTALAAEALSTATRAQTAARDAVDRLRTAHLAHTLAVDLVPGEPCPVCDQAVQTLPVRSVPAGLTEADAAARRAERDLADATRARDEVTQQLMVIVDRQTRAVALLDDLSGELARVPAIDELRAMEHRSRELEQLAQTARVAEQTARSAATATRRELEKLDRDQQRVAGQLHAQRDALVPLGAPAPHGSLVEAWMALAVWAADQRPALVERVGQLESERQTASQRMETEHAGLVTVVQDAGVGVPPTATVELIHRAIDREDHSLRERVAATRASIEHRASLVERRAEVDSRRSVAAELGRLLKADRFQRWLIEETLVDLASGASGRLHEMSAGRYSLELGSGGEFAVVDHAEGDERRGIRTLSGGETFQASLALALALSDHLVEMSGRRGHMLESIFLDEGFGTLDPESLDAVASTIESLGSHNRMVGIVTHVAALAERMPVRFLVSQGARSAVVERVTS